MGICAICKKTPEETTLYPGILASEMINICEECAEDQGVPIIKKPSESQLTQADRNYSVRERLDRMSGRRDTTDISRDQTVTQGNLAKLRMPKPKQEHPDALDNYYWEINMARRRAKMTTSQLAKKIDTTSYKIQSIEKGALPEDFKDIFLKLEALLGIHILKNHDNQINFSRKHQNQEKEILEAVQDKMNNPERELEELEEIEVQEEKIDIAQVRLSKRENLKDMTLNDLVDRKRAREKQKLKSKQDEMLGDDLDID